MLTVVLGGGVTPEGNLPHNIIKRVEKALEVYRESHSDAVVLSGKYSTLYGFLKPKKTEARAMHDYLLERGVPRSRMILEQKSRNTLANAYFLKKDVFLTRGEKHGIVITSEYHLQRVEFVFQKVFGKGFDLSFIASAHEFDSETEQKVKARQAYLLEQTQKFLHDMQEGDHDYLRYRMYRFLNGVEIPEWVMKFVSHG